MKRGLGVISVLLPAMCQWLTIGITVLAVLTNRIGGPWLFEVLCHFQVQYFVAVLLLGAIAFFTRRSRLILLCLFCGALLFSQIAPWYVPPISRQSLVNYSPGPNSSLVSYRVMSVNLNVGNTDAAQVLAFTEKEQPDLAIFIEVNDVMAKKLEALKTFLPYSSNQLTPYQPEAVIYSKDPLSDLVIQKFNTNNAVNLTAKVTTEKQTLSVVAIHPLPPISKSLFDSRNVVFDAVGDYVRSQTDPVVLIGDFNVTMWSPYHRKLVRDTGLKNVRKGFGILPSWPANAEYYFTPRLGWLAHLIQIPIDHCLSSDDLNVAGVRVGPDVGSDHLPIAIDYLL
ncbi:MAG: endonuclease/exonuclease/phosphatase family protein [Cyanobacteria bacterium P01_A01_bin.116]